MTQTSDTMRVLALGAALVLGAGTASHAQVANDESLKRSPVSATSVDSNALQPQVQLKLTDGSRITVEDAWESEQGIWYKQSGVTHLIRADRVKAIERKAEPKSKVEQPVVQITDPSVPKLTTSLQPVWIHLVGGARVEADSATESATGVWYTRGALSIFIERNRVDHIERESLADSESSSRKGRGWTTGRPKIDGLIRQNAAKFGLDPYLVFCVMEQESHFNSRAQSPMGARGLMQLMPGTAARFGVRNSFDPAQNIAGGTRFLKQLSQRFNGRMDLILASYNAGEGAVMKYGRKVPPYRETRNYVKRISYRYHRGKSPVAPVAPAPGNISTAGGS